MLGMSKERRKTQRQRLQAFAALETKGRHPNDQAFCAVVDVSRSGIGLKTGQPPLQGQVVHLRLAIGDNIHTIAANASRIQKRDAYTFDVGLDWSNCTDEEVAFLDEVRAGSKDRRVHAWVDAAKKSLAGR